MILVDTSIWIRSTRRYGLEERHELQRLLAVDIVATTDFVMAEVLQGTSSQAQYEEWKDKLSAPHFYATDSGDWMTAAKISFDLRRQGLATPLSDLVIASVALRHNLEVYAFDSHFERVPGLRLFSAGGPVV
jgi:predicted nucleic acid-binding protein